MKTCLFTTPLSIIIFTMHSCAPWHLYHGFSVTLFIKGAVRRWNQKWPFEDQYISICLEATFESRLGGKDVPLRCVLQWPCVAETQALSTISGGGERNQGLALFNRVPLLWGNIPWGR